MAKSTAVLFIVMFLAGITFGGVTEKEIKVDSGDLLEFDLDAGGSINITTWSSDAVAVSASVSGRDADIVAVRIEETSDGVLVTSDYSESRRSTSSDIDFDVRVPRFFNVKIKSNGGGVSIDGLEGEVRGKTMGGSLTLKNLRGTLKLTTMGGPVTLTDSDVDGKVTTMGGEVLVQDVIGDVDVKSMGGEVVHRRVTRRDGSFTGDQVKISSMGGSIDVDEAPAGADVHTMGGDITIDSASEFVKAKTMGGDIRMSNIDGWVNATTMAGDVHVAMVGGYEVELISMLGEITLIVPEGVGMEIDIELAYTKNSRRSYTINSDFSLSKEESPDWDYDHGSPRKTVRGTGVIGDGSNRVVIRTVNGNVNLKQGW